MGWTKREFVTAAFTKLGLASYAFDPASAEMLSAGRTLDALMADWNARGIRIGYPLVNPTEIDLDTNTNITDGATRAVVNNLALELASDFGVEVMQTVRASARAGYITLLSRACTPLEMQMPSTLPVGAGNKPIGSTNSPFFPSPTVPLDSGPDDELSFD